MPLQFSLPVNSLFENIEYYWDYRRKRRSIGFKSSIVPFIEMVHKGIKLTDEKLTQLPYYEYVKSGWSVKYQKRKTAEQRFLSMVKDTIELYEDIKKNGIKNPVHLWVQNKRMYISRGNRRLAILYVLGKKYVPVIVYESRDLCEGK